MKLLKANITPNKDQISMALMSKQIKTLTIRPDKTIYPSIVKCFKDKMYIGTDSGVLYCFDLVTYAIIFKINFTKSAIIEMNITKDYIFGISTTHVLIRRNTKPYEEILNKMITDLTGEIIREEKVKLLTGEEYIEEIELIPLGIGGIEHKDILIIEKEDEAGNITE